LDGNVVLLLLVVAIVVFLLYTRNRPPKTPAAVELTRLLGIVPCMSGAQFEVFVAKIMRGLGYRATVLGGSGDQGVDVIATAGKERIAIQCKNYAKPVGNKPVQEVYAGARHHRCTAAWVVAPEGFTKGAVELARSVGVSLRDAQDLRGWIRQIDAKERAKNAREDNKKEVTLASERSGTVDLDARSTRNTEGRMTERNMEKHTLTVGSARLGETVRFTAEVLGTTHVNGGAGGDLDVTFYQLPDHTYRVLMETEDATMLEPSNMSEALPIGEPAEYGSYTLEEINAHDLYGPALEALMKVRTEGESRKNTVRDLD
jgi:restriction system protein